MWRACVLLCVCAAAARERGFAVRRCGFHFDCPRNYSTTEINKSVALWDPSDMAQLVKLQQKHLIAQEACVTAHVLSSGGYCLVPSDDPKAVHDIEVNRAYPPARPFHAAVVNLSGATNGSYYLPPSHLRPDPILLSILEVLLKPAQRLGTEGQKRGPAATEFLSLIDFGAGVGQLGHELQAKDPNYPYLGFDGAGNTENLTQGYVRWFDLTMPLSLPRADWLISLEVGEHIPHAHEMMVIRNLHAHNCRGIILSWAHLGQFGSNHINNHNDTYLVAIFEELGYTHDEWMTALLRNKHANDLLSSLPRSARRSGGRHAIYAHLQRNLLAFVRNKPLRGNGCSDLPRGRELQWLRRRASASTNTNDETRTWASWLECSLDLQHKRKLLIDFWLEEEVPLLESVVTFDGVHHILFQTEHLATHYGQIFFSRKVYSWYCSSDPFTARQLEPKHFGKHGPVYILKCPSANGLTTVWPSLPSSKTGRVPIYNVRQFIECEELEQAPQKDAKFGACTMIRRAPPSHWRDQKLSLLDWIKHHHLLGVQHFWVYVNEPWEGLQEYLPQLPYVSYIPYDYFHADHWNHSVYRFTGLFFWQVPMQMNCIYRAKRLQLEYVTTTDVDEFIWVASQFHTSPGTARSPLETLVDSIPNRQGYDGHVALGALGLQTKRFVLERSKRLAPLRDEQHLSPVVRQGGYAQGGYAGVASRGRAKLIYKPRNVFDVGVHYLFSSPISNAANSTHTHVPAKIWWLNATTQACIHHLDGTMK